LKLRHLLTPLERDELANVMLNEPVIPGRMLSPDTARSLWYKGLILRVGTGFMANWEQIKQGTVRRPKTLAEH
jgi:hypothetical protein